MYIIIIPALADTSQGRGQPTFQEIPATLKTLELAGGFGNFSCLAPQPQQVLFDELMQECGLEKGDGCVGSRKQLRHFNHLF